MIELTKVRGTISAPIIDVFQYVTNMENYGYWFPGVQAITSNNNAPHASVGKTYVETLLLPDGEHQLNITVTECKANHFFLTRGDLEGVLPQMTIEFEPKEENNCQIELTYHSRNSDFSEDSPIVVALRNDLSVRASSGIANLKNILER
ncbi:SRPBCC family protein [uncultured Vibrio sp.]|uniref:SRPBCC family protein n=1 Tax=uncultured Vibrio sp. TaxID=114054 RepID=UPI0025F2231B|nr:SRPBCC family protein [uncultured Vibrio sp.]